MPVCRVGTLQKLIKFLSSSSWIGSRSESNLRDPNCPKRWLVDGNRGNVKYYLISTYEAHVTQHFKNIAFHLSGGCLSPNCFCSLFHYPPALLPDCFAGTDSSHFIQRIENDKMERTGLEQRT